MASLKDKAKAAHVVVECGPELYHMECYRREKGDIGAIVYLTRHYRRKESLSPADAAIRAGNFLNDVDALKTGAFGFKQARSEAAKKTREEAEAESSEFVPSIA
ncbi:hypothetical protein [Paraburkholderia sp. MM6662-R1]|uniref:hypothetical protein n=1 Tax=Paraburkholderia sp. MM6662-R1 TaxID=2991066 RepID=UPI003D22DF2F